MEKLRSKDDNQFAVEPGLNISSLPVLFTDNGCKIV
jgi:hypothetical protein